MMLKTRRIVEAVLFITLVYTATIVVQVYQPTTGGYFNLGESMIYLAALISTPVVAGIAGGFGAALADLSTGYAVFAPGTLIIKFMEGYIAGVMVNKLRRIHGFYKALAASVAYALVFVLVSTILWSGGIYIGPERWLEYKLTPFYAEIPLIIWTILGALLGGTVLYLLLRRVVASGEIYGLAIAGSIMVLGYFLYEFFVSNPLTGREPIAAIAEIPINIGQVIAGITVAIPVASWLRRAGYTE